MKQGKNKHDTLSYRAISLTSNYLGKIIECLITSILDWYIEKKNFSILVKVVFEKNRNTQDHFFRLQNDIQNALNDKPWHFLDIEKAYDMLWREGLLFKILQIYISGKMFHWIRYFFLKKDYFKLKLKILTQIFIHLKIAHLKEAV